MAETTSTNNKLNKDGLSALLELLNATLQANFTKVNEKLAQIETSGGGTVADKVEPDGTTAVSGKAVTDYVKTQTDALDERIKAVEDGSGLTLADSVTEEGTGAVSSKGIFEFVTSKLDEVNECGCVLADEVTEDGELAVKSSGIYAFVNANLGTDMTTDEVTELYNSIFPESYFTTEEAPE